MGYFVLLKTKKAKSWSGAIPANPSATRSNLETLIKRTLNKRYTSKVVTGAEFQTLVKKGKVRLLKQLKKRATRK